MKKECEYSDDGKLHLWAEFHVSWRGFPEGRDLCRTCTSYLKLEGMRVEEIQEGIEPGMLLKADPLCDRCTNEGTAIYVPPKGERLWLCQECGDRPKQQVLLTWDDFNQDFREPTKEEGAQEKSTSLDEVVKHLVEAKAQEIALWTTDDPPATNCFTTRGESVLPEIIDEMKGGAGGVVTMPKEEKETVFNDYAGHFRSNHHLRQVAAHESKLAERRWKRQDRWDRFVWALKCAAAGVLLAGVALALGTGTYKLKSWLDARRAQDEPPKVITVERTLPAPNVYEWCERNGVRYWTDATGTIHKKEEAK